MFIDCSRNLNQLVIIRGVFKDRTDFDKLIITIRVGNMMNTRTVRTGETYVYGMLRLLTSLLFPLNMLALLKVDVEDTDVRDQEIVPLVSLFESHPNLVLMCLPLSHKPPEKCITDIIERVTLSRRKPISIQRWDEAEDWYIHRDISTVMRVMRSVTCIPTTMHTSDSYTPCVIDDTLIIRGSSNNDLFAEVCTRAKGMKFAKIDVTLHQETSVVSLTRAVVYPQISCLCDLLVRTCVTHLKIKGYLGSHIDLCIDYPHDGITRTYKALREGISGHPTLESIDMSEITPNPRDEHCVPLVEMFGVVKCLTSLTLPRSEKPIPKYIKDNIRCGSTMYKKSVSIVRW